MLLHLRYGTETVVILEPTNRTIVGASEPARRIDARRTQNFGSLANRPAIIFEVGSNLIDLTWNWAVQDTVNDKGNRKVTIVRRFNQMHQTTINRCTE